MATNILLVVVIVLLILGLLLQFLQLLAILGIPDQLIGPALDEIKINGLLENINHMRKRSSKGFAKAERPQKGQWSAVKKAGKSKNPDIGVETISEVEG